MVDIWDLVYLWADLVSRDLDPVLPILDTALGVAVMAEQGSAVLVWWVSGAAPAETTSQRRNNPAAGMMDDFIPRLHVD